MTAPALLQLYVEPAVLLAAGWALFAAAWAWCSRRGADTSPRRWRDAALVVMAAAVLLPLATRLVPRGGEFRPRPMGGTPIANVRAPAPRPAAPSGRGLPAYTLRYSSSQQVMAAGILLLMAAGTAASLVFHWTRRRRLRAELSSLPILRRLGRVTVAVCDVAPTPYAARAAGRAWIVVPADLIDDVRSLRVLVAHELQHHRQRDLHVLEVMELLRAAFFWNPAVAAWARMVEELQEVACDAAVVGRGRAEARAYGELLLRAARIDGRERFVPRGASAASGRSSSLLKRRISMVMVREGAASGRGGWWTGAVCIALLAGAALGARSAVLEKKLETRDVAVLAEKVGARGLVVPVNDVVVDEVNRWLATSRDRVFLRESRQRLEERREMVEAALARHRVPSALAAVAVVESGFRPLEQKSGFRAAGVWQFIPDTARVFGLKVDGEKDERLDLEKETDAAARYLAALHRELGDWPLAVAGYSEGGRRVATVAQQAQTRDAWELIRTGKLGRYAATVVAAALVLEDERLLADAAR